MKKIILLTAALLALPAFAGSAHADELPDEMLGKWCFINSKWDSAVFTLFVQSDCSGKDDTGFILTKTSERYFGPEPQKGYPNATCTIDRVTELADRHYLTEVTCKDDGKPDSMHPGRGEPYQGGGILYLDTCGRLQSKDPEYCHPHCDEESEPPPEACRVS
jgi:hypothetical protein